MVYQDREKYADPAAMTWSCWETDWFERRLKEMVVDSLLECSKNLRTSHPKKKKKKHTARIFYTLNFNWSHRLLIKCNKRSFMIYLQFGVCRNSSNLVTCSVVLHHDRIFFYIRTLEYFQHNSIWPEVALLLMSTPAIVL